MKNANQKLLDYSTRHQIEVMRLSDKYKKKVLRLFLKLEKDILRSLQLINPADPISAARRRSRLQSLFRRVTSLSAEAHSSAVKTHRKSLINVAQWENNWSRFTLGKVIGVNLDSIVFNKSYLKRIADDTLIQGAPSKEWWAKQDKDMVHRFKNEIRMGLLQGESMQDMRDRVTSRVMPASRRQAEALVRTSVQAVAQRARVETFRSADDVIKQLQWLSTLDTRTSEICMARSGKLYDLDLNPIGHDLPALGGPPAHWNCRSTLIPITKSWEELGVPIKEKMPPGTQASMDGQVPEDLNYEEWLKTQSEDIQKEVLGTKKFKKWKSGKIQSFSQLVDPSFMPSVSAPIEIIKTWAKKGSFQYGDSSLGPALTVSDPSSPDAKQALSEILLKAKDTTVPDGREDGYNYLIRSIENMLHKDYLGVVHFDPAGNVLAAAAVDKVLKDSLHLDTFGSLGKGAGEGVLYRLIRLSKELDKQGRISLFAEGSPKTINWYAVHGFDTKPGQTNGRVFMNAEPHITGFAQWFEKNKI